MIMNCDPFIIVHVIHSAHNRPYLGYCNAICPMMLYIICNRGRTGPDFDVLMQDCIIPIANALDILQSWTKLSIKWKTRILICRME